METLPEAHGRSAEQSQPPETCVENDYGEIAEEKSSVPVRHLFDSLPIEYVLPRIHLSRLVPTYLLYNEKCARV